MQIIWKKKIYTWYPNNDSTKTTTERMSSKFDTLDTESLAMFSTTQYHRCPLIYIDTSG